MMGTVIDLLTHVQCLISIYNYRDNRDNKVHYRNNKNFIIAHPNEIAIKTSANNDSLYYG